MADDQKRKWADVGTEDRWRKERVLWLLIHRGIDAESS
jgi:hypothetical protein